MGKPVKALAPPSSSSLDTNCRVVTGFDGYGRVDAGSKWPGIVVEVARTDRSVCHWCHEAVQAGQFRIGMQSTSKPRMVIAWQHPGCFAEGMNFVTTSPQPHKPMYGEHRNQSCRHTGKAFSVNEPRLACTGETCVPKKGNT